jgi:hypothetical protein
MRSSPNFWVVNRRGLGFHISVEQFGNDSEFSTDKRSPEIATKGNSGQASGIKLGGRKAALLAVVGLVQLVPLIYGDISDIVTYVSSLLG